MKNSKQLALSALVILSALAVVAFQLRDGEAAVDQEMDGHDHAAMVAGGGEQKPVKLSVEDARRIGVTFADVERRVLELSIETLGTVAWDETRIATVNPKVEGWVERLFVDFTGAPVQKGQPLMSVYSPMLVSAQEELVLAARLSARAGDGRAADNARGLLESARRRLAYWDIPEEDIRRIEETGVVTKTLTLRAPASGIVVEKDVVEGDRIMPGMTLYRIADLSRVWIEVDVFEKDLALVREGQTATARFEAFPGKALPAQITYVHPTVSMDSRTGRIRLELSNPGLALKPGMYARVALDVPPAASSLVVPRGAVISTGPRSLVFVQAADGSLVPREVAPGRTVGRDLEILAGLVVGERVVSAAAFLVDAESSLGALTAGRPAMADPPAPDVDHSGHAMPDTAAATGSPAEPGHEGHAQDEHVGEQPEGHEGHGGHDPADAPHPQP